MAAMFRKKRKNGNKSAKKVATVAADLQDKGLDVANLDQSEENFDGGVATEAESEDTLGKLKKLQSDRKKSKVKAQIGGKKPAERKKTAVADSSISLSFGHGEDGEEEIDPSEFIGRKVKVKADMSASRFHREESERKKRKSVEGEAVNKNHDGQDAQDDEGEYSARKLAELRKNQMYKANTIPSPGPAMGENHPMSDIPPVPNVDESEEDEFIPLEAKKLAQKKKSKRVSFAVKLEEKEFFNDSPLADGSSTLMDVDMDEERARNAWEEEQIRRGGDSRAFSDLDSGAQTPQKASHPGKDNVSGRSSSGHTMSMERVLQNLNRDVETLRSRVDKIDREGTRVTADRVEAEKTVQKLERERGPLGDAYHWYQQSREYFTDLSFCLRKKMVMISELKVPIWEGRKRKVARRKDHYAQYFADDIEALRKRVTVENVRLGTNGAKKQEDKSQEEDHFGRDKAFYIQQQLTKRNKERAARRQRIRARRNGTCVSEESISKNKLKILQTQLMDTAQSDVSSDDEETQSRVQKLQEASELVMSDVAEEFKSAAGVLDRVLSWKSTFPKTFEEAYCQAYVPKLLEPFVELELLHWNPLTVSKSQFVHVLSTTTFQTVLRYENSLQGNSVLHKLIHLVVVPKLLQCIESYWDVRSSSEWTSLFVVIKELVSHSNNEKEFEPVKSAVQETLRREIHELCVPVIRRRDENLEIEDFECSFRQLGRAQQLAKCTVTWQQNIAARWPLLALPEELTMYLVKERLVPFLDGCLQVIVRNETSRETRDTLSYELYGYVDEFVQLLDPSSQSVRVLCDAVRRGSVLLRQTGSELSDSSAQKLEQVLSRIQQQGEKSAWKTTNSRGNPIE